MRSFKSNNTLYCLFCIILFGMAMALVVGCGEGGGPLDELGGRYVFNLTLNDGQEDGTQDIDLIRNLDCSNDGAATTDDIEIFTQVYGTITASVAAEAPGIELKRFSVSYIPTPSLDEFGVYQDPPVIPDQLELETSFFIDSGETASETIIVMTFDTKEFVVNNFPLTLDSALYTIEIEVVYETYEGDEETYRFYKDVTMSNFDRC